MGQGEAEPASGAPELGICLGPGLAGSLRTDLAVTLRTGAGTAPSRRALRLLNMTSPVQRPLPSGWNIVSVSLWAEGTLGACGLLLGVRKGSTEEGDKQALSRTTGLWVTLRFAGGQCPRRQGPQQGGDTGLQRCDPRR